jgi:hypothetical protein
MIVAVERIDAARWRAVGTWTGPPTPIATLPPEVEYIREVQV